MKVSAFHLSLPCKDKDETKNFYKERLGFSIGRHSHNWCDVSLAGNQITFIENGDFYFPSKHYNFEGSILPSFHFGLLLDQKDWNAAYERCHAAGCVTISPIKFLDGRTGAHQSFFVEDPNGYLLEFKNFAKSDEVFKG